MPLDWDEHYRINPDVHGGPTPLLMEVTEMVPPGRALDLACGPGRHALYLAKLGWQVTAIDSSHEAIRQLREQARAAGVTVDAHVANLEDGEFVPEAGAYDLICNFFYLQRDLFPKIRESLRPGGVFAGAIHLIDEVPCARPHNPSFVLQPGELRREFDGWKILYYSEGIEPGHKRPAARIIARRA